MGQFQSMGDGPDGSDNLCPGRHGARILAVALLFGAINLPSVSTWCLLGQGMQRVLTDQRRLMIFNWTMALLLVLSLYPLLI